MTRPDRIEALERLTRALYERELATLAPISAEEARLKAALARLAGQTDGLQARMGTDLALGTVGADVAWLRWSGQARQRINGELSRLRVLRAHRIGTVRRAFGKHQVALALLDGSRIDAARRQDKARAERLLGLSSGSGVLAGDIEDEDFADR